MMKIFLNNLNAIIVYGIGKKNKTCKMNWEKKTIQNDGTFRTQVAEIKPKTHDCTESQKRV